MIKRCVYGVYIKARVQASRFYCFYCFYLILCYYDFNMHIEDLLPANLYLITLLTSEQVPNLKDSACNMFKW